MNKMNPNTAAKYLCNLLGMRKEKSNCFLENKLFCKRKVEKLKSKYKNTPNEGFVRKIETCLDKFHSENGIVNKNFPVEEVKSSSNLVETEEKSYSVLEEPETINISEENLKTFINSIKKEENSFFYKVKRFFKNGYR
jgi:hypothetical protein